MWLDVPPPQELIAKRHEIELHAQNMITILDSIANIIRRGDGEGSLYDHLMSMATFLFDNK